jgi:hypothetical protein
VILLRFLVLLALLFSPFGRMAAAEAMMPHHQQMSMAGGHCDPMPAPDRGDEERSIDCMIACAAVTGAESPQLRAPRPAASRPVGLVLAGLSGLHPEADPPPPRLS